jgi:type II secretory pathway component PulJ
MTAEPLETTRTARATQAHDELVRRLRALADLLDADGEASEFCVVQCATDSGWEERLVNQGAASAYRDAANRLRDITDPQNGDQK